MELLGEVVLAGIHPFRSIGSGNTITYQAQISQAIAATDATKIGLSNFNSAQFSVDANGFVSFSGSAVPETLTGDVGGPVSPVAGNIDVIAGQASQNCGSTVNFSGAVGTLELNVSDTNLNTIIGSSSGNATLSGLQNIGLGSEVLPDLTTGNQNIGIGPTALQSLQDGDGNVGIGFQVLNSLVSGSSNTVVGSSSLVACTGTNNSALGADVSPGLVTGNDNIFIGVLSGQNYTGSESSNIIIGSSGVVGDNSTTRIGEDGTQTKCFIGGINGNSVSNQLFVTIDSSTGQLGTTSQEDGTWTDQGISAVLVSNHNYFATAAITLTLPASPVQGDTIKITCDTASTVIVTANTGQTIRIGITASSSGGTATSTVRGNDLCLVYRASTTQWIQSVGAPQGTWNIV